MIGFLIPVLWKVLEWSFVTACVLVYIELGAPGGEAIQAIVTSIKGVLLNIDWSSLAEAIGGHLKSLAVDLWGSFNNHALVADADNVKTCIDNVNCLVTVEK